MAVNTDKKLMRYMSKAIADYGMIRSGDRVMVCVSGGKDSYTLATLLQRYRRFNGMKFELFAFTLDQSQPGWDDSSMRRWYQERGLNYHIRKRDTYAVVKEKIPAGKTYCSLCSRLRRGNIYQYAREHGFNKVALGHHRDDVIESLMMSILYNGAVRTMPPKLRTDDRELIVVRPLVYCQEQDIIRFAEQQAFPIIPCNLCGTQENMTRKKVKAMIAAWACDNPKIPSNILHAAGNIQKSQLLDRKLWDFDALDDSQQMAVDGCMVSTA